MQLRQLYGVTLYVNLYDLTYLIFLSLIALVIFFFFPFAAYHQLGYVGGKFIISLSNTHTDGSNILSCL
jgi:hypothetical protein